MLDSMLDFGLLKSLFQQLCEVHYNETINLFCLDIPENGIVSKMSLILSNLFVKSFGLQYSENKRTLYGQIIKEFMC